MQSIDRRKLAALMFLHLLWGTVLWLSISNLGLGLSTDSVPLLFAGSNLAAGRALLSFDGSPLILWPPLYPILLATIHLLTGLSTFAAAHVLQVVAFLGISACLSVLSLRLFPDDLILALAASLLSEVGVVVVSSFSMVGSDYLHLFLVVLCALLVALYVEHPSGRLYLGIFAVAMLAMLQRYLGIATIAMAAAAMAWRTTGSLRQRLVRSAFISLAATPSVLWLVLTSPLDARRAPVSFTENFGWFSRGILGWFLPADAIQAHPVFYPTLLWILLALIAFGLWAGRSSVPPFAMPVLLFGAVYALVLFGSASIAYYNRLEGRFLLPLYIPFVVALLLAVQAALAAAHRRFPAFDIRARIAAFGLLAILFLLLLSVTLPAVLASHWGLAAGDNVFNTYEWHDNGALRYWQRHSPGGSYILLSNEPDGVAFYTQHSCSASPRRLSGPYGQVEFPVESYAASLFASGRPVYLLRIEPDDRSYYYKPEDLASIATVEQLYAGPGGAVYRLSPKPGGP